MEGNVSILLFLASIVCTFLVLWLDFSSPVLLIVLGIIGLVIGFFGIFRNKCRRSKFGAVLNSVFMIFTVFMIYVPPIIFGD